MFGRGLAIFFKFADNGYISPVHTQAGVLF